MTTLFLFLFSTLAGYLFFLYLNDPIDESNRRKHRLPQIRYKNIEFLPYFRIHIKEKTYHLHHWLTLTIITGITFFWYQGAASLLLLKGAAIGGIFQGLRYPDRFKFRQPRGK